MRTFTFILLLTSKLILAQSFLESEYQIGLLNNSINAQYLINGSNFLDDDFKNQFINDLEDENTIFLFQEYGTKYSNSKGWSIGYKNNIMGRILYPKELIELALYGNDKFIGQKLSLTPLSAEIVHFTKMNYGLKVNKNINASLGIILGHQLLNLNIKKGDFNTEEFGTSISYDLELEAQFSDTNNLQIYSVNGIGFSFGADYKKEIKNGTIFLSINDLGIIRWNENTSNFNIESDYSFEGIELNDFNSFNDSLISNELDEIENDLQGNTVQNYYHYRLPFRFNAKLSQSLDFIFANELTLNTNYINNFYPTPRWSLQFHKDLKKHRLSLGYHIGGIEHPGFEFTYGYSGDVNQFRIFTRQANYFNNENVFGIHLGISFKKILKSKQEKKNEK
jgi:hypothetical protein